MLLIEEKVEKHCFERDLHLKGLPIAQKKAKKREIYRKAIQFRPEACKACRTTLFCRQCSLGTWLYE